MTPPTSDVIYLKDYTPPAWLIDTVVLNFDIHLEYTEVRSTLTLRSNSKTNRLLELDGEELELRALTLNGQTLPPQAYVCADGHLRIPDVTDQATLETLVRIYPDDNTQLSGLYRSKDGYFTQCEAQGFRRITFYLDRPDVMARFTCTLHADKNTFPVLLANGNPVAHGDEPHGRHWATWQDPFAKPSYLFACVAARLEVLEDTHVTNSGRPVHCAIYVEPGKLDQCTHAMAALKNAMAWDEKVFGLEMDLDHYTIVAVGDFNAGAMENKGLNIFNTKYVLARPDTATDSDFRNIDRVVAHEYFHNWTGNRVTCRDWFQLSLKEGLTVFRDQQFGMDVHSAAVTRIQEVRGLRATQFPEDAGPMAHPIRPASYAEINNFYTATVYEKGAEVIRMIHTLIGAENFRRGMDLYFQRHDGQAVTCENFVAAMQDASEVNLQQFLRWYNQAGTPILKVRTAYEGDSQCYTLEVEQLFPPTAYEARLAREGMPQTRGAYHLPLKVALYDQHGTALPLHIKGMAGIAAATELTLSVHEAHHSFVFENIPEVPIPSLLRGFSAPVILEHTYSETELALLMRHDTDPFNRWEAGQRLASTILQRGIQAFHTQNGQEWILPIYIDAIRDLLVSGLSTVSDLALSAEALMLPSETYLAEQMDIVDPTAIHGVRTTLRKYLAQALRDQFEELYQKLSVAQPYSPDPTQSGSRALRNICLDYLAELRDKESNALVIKHFENSGNMTDTFAALQVIANLEIPERNVILDSFYSQWKHEALVIDKWLQVQATSSLPETLQEVRALMAHEAFDIRNPNKVYALVRSFCAANPLHFHAYNGEGYRLAADVILQIDPMNPQVAARIARSFDRWRKFDTTRQAHAHAQLERIRKTDNLSDDVGEIIDKALE